MNKLKIIVVCNVFPPHFIGGAELIAYQQAKELNNLGHKIVVFAGEIESKGEPCAVVRDVYDGLDVYRVQVYPDNYDSNNLNFINEKIEFQFNELLKEFRPDIVHFHNIIGLSVKLIYFAKLFGASTVCTLHDNWGFCYKNTTIDNDGNICGDYSKCYECKPFVPAKGKNIPIRLRKDFIRLMFLYLDLYIFPSKYLAEVYMKAGFDRNKIVVLWNGIDVEKFNHITKKDGSDFVRFTFVGYFGRHKGVHILLEALHKLSTEDKSKTRINLVGGGEELQNYKRYLAENNLEENVKFWGKIDNKEIAKVYAETDVLALPSIWPENQPVSITEAMASHIPAIVSNAGGSRELIKDGVNGLHFETGSAFSLYRRMKYYIDNPNKIIEHGDNGFNIIKTHSLSSQTNELEKYYHVLIKAKRNISNINKNSGVVSIHGTCFDDRSIAAMNKSVVCNDKYIIHNDWMECKNKITNIVLSPSIKIEDVYDEIVSKECMLINRKNSLLSYLAYFTDSEVLFDNNDLEMILNSILEKNESFHKKIKNNLPRYLYRNSEMDIKN